MAIHRFRKSITSKALLVLCLPLLSRATFSFGTVTSQDPLPECNVRVRCSGPAACADTCEDGSVVLDDWLTRTIRFQYDLVGDRSFKFGPILGANADKMQERVILTANMLAVCFTDLLTCGS